MSGLTYSVRIRCDGSRILIGDARRERGAEK
jgi:hypothetical protein